MEHYRYQLVIPEDTREINVSYTLRFLNKFIMYPTITPEDRILHGLNTLAGAIKDARTATYDAEINNITSLRDICTGWAGNDTLAKPEPPVHTPCKSLVPEPIVQPCRYPMVKEEQYPQKVQQPTRVPEETNTPGKYPRVHFQDHLPDPAPRVPPKKEAIRSHSHPSEQPISCLTIS